MKSKTKDIESKLKKLGVKYELSDSPHKPFKIIHKPVNKSDEWYKKFEEIIDLYHLGNAIKTQKLNERIKYKELRKLIREEIETLKKHQSEKDEVANSMFGKNFDQLSSREQDEVTEVFFDYYLTDKPDPELDTLKSLLEIHNPGQQLYDEVKFVRKPGEFEDVYEETLYDDLSPNVQRYIHSLEVVPVSDLQEINEHGPTMDTFMAEYDNKYYLISTEGFDYARYVGRIIF